MSFAFCFPVSAFKNSHDGMESGLAWALVCFRRPWTLCDLWLSLMDSLWASSLRKIVGCKLKAAISWEDNDGGLAVYANVKC